MNKSGDMPLSHLDSSKKDKKTADSSKCSDRIEQDVTVTVGGI